MASLLPVLKARHTRKGSMPEHTIYRLKSFARPPGHSASPSPDLNCSSRLFRPLNLSVDIGVQTTKVTHQPLHEEFSRLETSLDKQEMLAMSQGELEMEDYLRYMEEIVRRVKRWDGQLGGMLARGMAGLRRSVQPHRDPPAALKLTAPCVTHSSTQTAADPAPAERYPGLAEAQDALDRLRDVKYSGVSTKLSELHRALSHLISTNPPDPPSLHDIAVLPEAFSQELHHTLRLLHKELTHSFSLRFQKPPTQTLAIQTEPFATDHLKVFDLEQAIRERDAELSRVKNDFADVRLKFQGNEAQMTKLTTENLNLEEKIVKLEMELKVLKTKEQNMQILNQEIAEKQEMASEKLRSLQQSNMHLLSLLYTAVDKVRKAEKEALRLEEALVQAELANSGGNETEIREKKERIRVEFERKREEMKRRHQIMEQQLQEQTLKTDTLEGGQSPLRRQKVKDTPQDSPVRGSAVLKIQGFDMVSTEENQGSRRKKTPTREVSDSESEKSEEEISAKSPTGQREESYSPVRSPTSPSRSPVRFQSPLRAAESPSPQRFPVPSPFPSSPAVSELQSTYNSSPLKLHRVAATHEKTFSESQPVSSQLDLLQPREDAEKVATETLAAMSAENAAEEKALLDQLSASEQAVFYKAKALIEHQKVWEQAVRSGMCSKATQTGEHSTAVPSIHTPELEESEPWLKHIAPSPQGLSPRSKRRYHQAVLQAFIGHSERCGVMCQHLQRAMQVRRKVRGLLFPLRVVNVRYRVKK